MSLKPVLAVGVAVGGLYLAGTVSSALTDNEPSPPKMTDHEIDMSTVVWVGDRHWTVRPPKPRGDHGSH